VNKWSKFGPIIRPNLIQIHYWIWLGHGNPLCGIPQGEGSQMSLIQDMLGWWWSRQAPVNPHLSAGLEWRRKWTSILKSHAVQYPSKRLIRGFVNLSIDLILPELANNRQSQDAESIKKYRGILKQIRIWQIKGVYVVMRKWECSSTILNCFSGCLIIWSRYYCWLNGHQLWFYVRYLFSPACGFLIFTVRESFHRFVAPGEMSFSTFPEIATQC